MRAEPAEHCRVCGRAEPVAHCRVCGRAEPAKQGFALIIRSSRHADMEQMQERPADLLQCRPVKEAI